MALHDLRTRSRTSSVSTNENEIPWANGQASLKPIRKALPRSAAIKTTQKANWDSMDTMLETEVEAMEVLESQVRTQVRKLEAELQQANDQVARRDGEIERLRESGAAELEVLKREVERLNDHGNPLAELEAVGDQMRDNQLENLLLERDSLRDALASAHSDVLHHESEVQVLREALDQQNMELAHLNASNEFAEAESRSARSCLRDQEAHASTQDAHTVSLKAEILILVSERDDVASQLNSSQQDLKDALAREARQEESSRSLITAQQELEAAYADAVSQLEAWKADADDDASTDADAEGEDDIEEREEDSEAGEPHEEDVGNEDEQAEISFAAPNTTLEEYDVIDLQREMMASTNARIAYNNISTSQLTHRTTTSFKHKLHALVHPQRHAKANWVGVWGKPSSPSPHAVKLLAIKELEDDLIDYRQLLATLCDEFSSTDPHKLQRLQKLQNQIGECTDNIRLTATKLKAVRGFAE